MVQYKYSKGNEVMKCARELMNVAEVAKIAAARARSWARVFIVSHLPPICQEFFYTNFVAQFSRNLCKLTVDFRLWVWYNVNVIKGGATSEGQKKI